MENEDIEQVVISGDCITSLIEEKSEASKIKIGPGLRHEDNKVYVSKSGILRFKEPATYWVDSHQKRYVACKGENVVGVVTGRQGDYYKVDIGCSDLAILNSLSFEGASKRNRPNVVNGDVVFSKLIVANKDMEPEITCVDQSTGKAHGMGVLPDDGFLLNISMNLARKLISEDCPLLPEIGEQFAFEIVVGLNGKIALFCKSYKQLLVIIKVIQSSEYLSNEEIIKVIYKTFV